MDTIEPNNISWGGLLVCTALVVGAIAVVWNPSAPPAAASCAQQTERLRQIDAIEDRRVLMEREYDERSRVDNYLHDHCGPPTVVNYE